MLTGVRAVIIHDGRVRSILIDMPSRLTILTRKLILRTWDDLHIFTRKTEGITWISCIYTIHPVSPVPSLPSRNGVHPE
jgi:hypothetical protein